MSQVRSSQRSHLSPPSNPIYIQDETNNHNGKHLNTINMLSRLPAFEQKDNLTQLLYSKFVVKGVRPINHEAIVEQLKRQRSSQHKRSNTQTTVNCTKDAVIVHKQNSIHKEVSQAEGLQVFDRSVQKILHRKGKSQSNLHKFTKHPGFQRSRSITRPQSALPTSTRQLGRPRSAQTQVDRQTSQSFRNKSQRPHTAKDRQKNQNVCFQVSENRNQLLTVSESHPDLKGINYIQRNKRSVSAAKLSLYLTSPDSTNLPKSHRKEEEEKQIKQEVKLQFSHRQTVTPLEKKNIAQQQKQYLHFMKQNMPAQYQDCIEYLSHNELPLEESRSFFNCSLDSSQEGVNLKPQQVEDIQIQLFYKNFFHKCLSTEYLLKRTRPKKQEPELICNILNSDDSDKILELYKEIEDRRKYKKCFKQITQQIKDLTAQLNFFKQLKPEVISKVFMMDYQIFSVPENTLILPPNSPPTNIYVIFSGSVVRHNSQKERSLELNAHTPPEFSATLFDGDIFGVPAKAQDSLLSYSINAIEDCLLMSFPYEQYRIALSSNQNIQDRVQLLKEVLPSLAGKRKLTYQDYQTIAYKMQTASFPSQSLIAREGEHHDVLFIIAGGSVQLCFESVIKREKTNIDPLLRIKQPKKTINIADLRTNNLVNYEIIYENTRETQYYHIDPIEAKVRSDAINWKGFTQSMEQPNQHILPYSILSCMDNTRVYTLSFDRISDLSPHVVENIRELSQRESLKENIRRDQKQLNKWDKFKVKVCQDILKKKLTH